MKPEVHLANLLASRVALLWVTTTEERRVERQVTSCVAKGGYRAIGWDCADGARDIAEGRVIEFSPEALGKSPLGVLDRIARREQREVWILRDFDVFLEDVRVRRGLKTLERHLQDNADSSKFGAVVILATTDLPPSLRGCATVLDWPLPTREELARALDQSLEGALRTLKLIPERGTESRERLREIATKEGILGANGSADLAVEGAAGLTLTDAGAAYAYSLVAKRKIDPDVITTRKRAIVERDKLLRWMEPDPRGLDAIGGLAALKRWLIERRVALSPKAIAWGLSPPRGILVTGPSGTGKSLTAKAVASAWRVPLLSLDLGGLKRGIVGESERAIRQALAIADAVAPCVLFVDEFDKSMGDATSRGDAGVSSDQLGTLLTWMEERVRLSKRSVFVAASANDASSLAPELFRRFDGVFFVDLPQRREREEILAVTILGIDGHSLEGKKRDPKNFDLAAVAAATDQFSGGELAKVVEMAMFAACNDGFREPNTEDLLAAAAVTVPVSRTAKEKVKALREWAHNRAIPASDPEREDVTGPATDARTLDLGWADNCRRER